MEAKEKEKYSLAGFNKEQIQEIEKGQDEGLDTLIYEKVTFLAMQMRQIRLGLQKQLPVEVYAKEEFDWFQMEEIRKGLASGVDIYVYSSPEISHDKMRELRRGLEEGINLQEYMEWDVGIIREFRRARRAGVDIIRYMEAGYDAEQLYEIRSAIKKGIKIDEYLHKEYRAASIAEICKGLERGVDVSQYAQLYYSWRQMREIRKGLESRVDISKYSSRFYSGAQMREIRIGMEQGLDVDDYRRLRYTADEMEKKRLKLLAGDCSKYNVAMKSDIHAEDLKVEISANEMEAYLTILVPGKQIGKQELKERLAEIGICAGIQEEAVEKISVGAYSKKPILIAKGSEPVKGEDGWYEFFFRTKIEKKPKILEDGSVDYQNIDWFEMVKENQKLAIYHGAKEGKEGYNVRGTVLKSRKGIEKNILIGSGFKISEDKKTYYATKDGMITLEDNRMMITSHLLVDEVTTSTGNVRFNGSVHVLGNVGNGALISATDDIVIDGNVEGATLESGGSIVLKKGMNAAGKGLIKAKKNVVSRFFENVKVTARGNIEVERCLNSQLYAGGTISSSGIIAGGIVQAEKGFDIKHVGNQAGLRTSVRLRVDEEVWEENRKVKAEIREAKEELETLLNYFTEFTEKFPPAVRNNMGIFNKIEKAIFTKSRQMEKLKAQEEEISRRIKESREAKIIIAGQAHEGTIVEINERRWLAKDQYNITIRKQNEGIEVTSKW